MLLLWLALGCGGERCPEGMVAIPGGEVPLGEPHVARPWQQVARSVHIGAYCMDRYEYPNQQGVLPRVQVDWDQADRLCREQGKRLCTSDEWGRACRGTTRRRYAYGDTRDAEACNTPIDGSGPGQGAPPLAASGSHPRCVSPEGVYDLNGNLSEWVSDPWDGPPEPFHPEARVQADTWRMLRGGTMWSRTFYGQDCTSRHGHRRDFKNIDDGFRCCADPR